MSTSTYRDIPRLLSHRDTFQGNSMSATPGPIARHGLLDPDERQRLDGREVSYTVYSYDTPIAWVYGDDGSTYVVEQKFQRHHFPAPKYLSRLVVTGDRIL